MRYAELSNTFNFTKMKHIVLFLDLDPPNCVMDGRVQVFVLCAWIYILQLVSWVL